MEVTVVSLVGTGRWVCVLVYWSHVFPHWESFAINENKKGTICRRGWAMLGTKIRPRKMKAKRLALTVARSPLVTIKCVVSVRGEERNKITENERTELCLEKVETGDHILKSFESKKEKRN